ncbi:hypothetical protein A6C57_00390 [Fibrella sp. ES10-3-2-2]|nr:hypothetical protein A6C57_00390 [Fibrella sp. ES10-3-2-2]
MKHTLVVLFLLMSVSAVAQTPQPRAVRLYRYNDQVVLADSVGASPVTYPASLVSLRSVRNLIEVVVGSASVYYRPAQLLNSQGVAYGSTVSTSINNFLATAPKTSPAGIGSVADVNTSFSNTTQVINSTGKIYLLLTNVGSSTATVTVGTVSYSVPAGAAWEYRAIQDQFTGLYTPIPSVTITATSTTININQKCVQ